MDNLKRHFDKINEYILKYISKTYDDDNVYPRISSNITKKEYVSYVILNIYNLFANYSLTVNQYLTEYIKNDVDAIIEMTNITQKLLEDNKQYEEILHSALPKKNSITFSLNDNPILFELKNIYYSYNGKNDIYKNLNLSVKLHQWTHFQGKSGNGKTTLFNIILQRLQHQKGKILFQNKTYDNENIKSLISVVDTSYDLFDNYTILLNITYGLKDVNEGVMNQLHYYLEKFNLQHLSSRLHDNINFLSTGEKKRLKIIRLILHDRPIWFLDEVTENLDSAIEIVILKEISRIQKEKKKTILFISHRLTSEKFADIIYNIQGGKITKV